MTTTTPTTTTEYTGAKGPPRFLLRLVMKANIAIYRASGGKIMGKLGGAPVLLLTTTGRKTGAQRTTPLLYLAEGDTFAVVASAGGSATDPAWWRNLTSNPVATVEVGRRKLQMRAEEADAETRARLWPQLVAGYAGFAGYQKATTRPIPVVVLHPVAG